MALAWLGWLAVCMCSCVVTVCAFPRFFALLLWNRNLLLEVELIIGTHCLLCLLVFTVRELSEGKTCCLCLRNERRGESDGRRDG